MGQYLVGYHQNLNPYYFDDYHVIVTIIIIFRLFMRRADMSLLQRKENGLLLLAK